MYEDRTVEDRYLTNFSSLEKIWFRHDQHRKREYPRAFNNYLRYLLENDKSFPIFEMANPTTALEIKYILNRISQNDSRDTSFDLLYSDNIRDGDKSAYMLAKALKNKIDTDKMKEPAFLMVLTGTGDYAFRRKDGIYVVPIGCLKN